MKKNKTTREKIMKKTKIIVSLLTLALLGMVLSCSSSSGGSDPVGGDPVSVSATVIAKGTVDLGDGSTIPSVRDRWIFVSLSADKSATGYLVGVKAASQPAPSADEMKSDANVKKYNIGTEAINVILATRMGTQMLTYFDGNSAENAIYIDGDIGISGGNLVTATTPAGAANLFGDSMLAPNTAYAIYGMKAGATNVTKIGEATTDALNAATVTGLWRPSAPELNTTTLTLHRDNYEILPLQLFVPNYGTFTPPTIDSGPSFVDRLVLQDSLTLSPRAGVFTNSTREQFFVVVDGQSTGVAASRGFFLLLKGGNTYFFDNVIQRNHDAAVTGGGNLDVSFSATIQ